MKNLGKNFRETYTLYKQGQIPEDLLLHIGGILFGLEDMIAIEVSVKSIEDFITVDISNSIDAKYSDYLGGDFKLVETVNDLREIEFCDFDFAEANGMRWPNLLDKPGSFDNVGLICGGKYIEIFICWNDTGGPVWFIPYDIATDNVFKSLHQNEEFWSSQNDNTRK